MPSASAAESKEPFSIVAIRVRICERGDAVDDRLGAGGGQCRAEIDHRLLDLAEEAADAGVEHRAEVVEIAAARAPVDQHRADLLLELGERLGHRGLRQAAFLRRPADALQIADRLEQLELAKAERSCALAHRCVSHFYILSAARIAADLYPGNRRPASISPSPAMLQCNRKYLYGLSSAEQH